MVPTHMSAPVNESYYDKPIQQDDGTLLTIVRDKDGNQIGWNLTLPADADA